MKWVYSSLNISNTNDGISGPSSMVWKPLSSEMLVESFAVLSLINATPLK